MPNLYIERNQTVYAEVSCLLPLFCFLLCSQVAEITGDSCSFILFKQRPVSYLYTISTVDNMLLFKLLLQ